ncbi:AfsR/SARP family transcriptional regulator [Streptomyces sp. NBC_01268]|uniref:AfsR/SARP family transcriptional regulator n=1 Tax=Streptomyces sp. NBC_01268 TaxID=2903806 RepID=UPI002E30D141|nr:BTAD domain-containing putative transcriptional regulator [Streptomyces sp. NBC_01268]
MRLTNRPSRTTPSWPPTEGVRFRVLGPVQAWRGGDPLPVGSPQQRALLVALLLRDGRTATVGELIDAIWGEDPPSQALAAVRTYAVRLRKILDPGVLVSDSGGYALRVAPDALDLGVARDLEGASDRARSAGDRLLARDLLTQALDLWEGETLDTVPGPYAESRRTQLEDWRLQLLETRLDLDLEVGAHAEAVSELTALTAAHPLRERLRELLMLALYRSGRQAEALAVYADTRRLLADELGVDPNPELSRLQQRILQADPGLLGDPPDPDPDPDAEGPARPVRPAMLPATVRDFTGRARLVQELSEHLTDGTGDAVCALAGIGGVGKTTLAVHVAHSVRPHFPDGQLYADLQDFGARRLDPRAVLGSFLRALGTPESELTASSTELSARFRAALDGRRILVVLDNALDAAQVRPLLPGTPGCATLVTGRARMVDLEGARLVDLEVMSPEEALQLFTRIVGTERVQSEREAALDTVVACGFLPLAIRIAASRLAARRTWTVSVLAAKLADERRRLDELRAGDLAVKATFELGYGQLEPAQARAFRLLGLADGPDISLAAAATVLDLPVADAEELLEALVDTSFLESAAPGRYRYHDLVRLYARACAERDEQPPTEPGLALSRLLDFYLATASRVYALERPGDRLVDHVARVEQEGLSFTDSHGALEWLYAEAGCLLDCALQSTSPGSLPRAVDLLWLVRDLSESGSHSARYAAVATALNEAADALGDARTAGRSALVLAEAEATLGRFDRAAEWADRVRPGTPPDLAVPSRTAQLRGRVAQNRNRLEEAEAHLSRAVEAFRNDGDRPGEAGALSDLSRVRLAARDVSAALSMTEQAIAVLDDAGRSVRGAGARYARGLALTAAGRYDEARDVFHEARGVFRIHRQLVWEGMTSFRLAETELAAGRPGESAAYAEEALGQLARSGGDWRRGTVLTLLGRALQALDHNDRARVCWQEALAVFEARGAAEAEELRGLLDAAAASS